MGLIEWRVSDGEAGHRRFGIAQMLLAFAGFVLLVVGSTTGQMSLAGGSVVLTVLAILFFLWRVGPSAARAWNTGASGPFYAVAALALPVYVAMLVVLAVIAIRQGRDAIPDGLVAGMDHIVFIGVMTNALFGVALDAVAHDRRRIWAWADVAVLGLADIGLVGFATSLVAGFGLGERFFAPLMGIGLALGVVVLLRRLRTWARPGQRLGRVPAVPAG